MQYLSRTVIHRHTRLLQLRLAPNNLQHIIARAKHVRHSEKVRKDSRGLERLGRVEHDVRPGRE